MKDKVRPSGLVPTLMVFGALPSLPVTTIRYPMKSEHMSALLLARKEMARLVASSRIAQALSSTLPPSTRYRIDPGDRVRFYREQTVKWERPFFVEGTAEKGILDHLQQGIFQTVLCPLPTATPKMKEGEGLRRNDDSYLPLRYDVWTYR